MAASAEEPRYLDREWLRRHIAEEREASDLLGEIREALFGMQDGIVSTLAIVTAVGAATGDRFHVLVAGIASALAGVFSMAAGEYLSSKSQREIYEAQIDGEREEVEQRPKESEAEVAYMLEEEGLPAESARRVAAEFARYPNVLLKTMVEKELGISVDEGRGALHGALVMGSAFGVAALVPVIPYLVAPLAIAPWISVGLCAATLFFFGVLKSRWTRHGALRSGVEVVLLAALAGAAGYLFGSVLPALLGVAGVAG
jgi:VIT1/CCC1 family predicted Fe2+/Mn2+ transporter